ncbi:MAG: NUDIX hydrolase [Candidatus Nealsonbacteria bacterium]
MITCFFENNNKVFLRHVVVDNIVIKNNQILLVKRAPDTPAHPNKYSLPGGYLDRDETMTQGTLREFEEETGYKGKIVSLFRINSDPNRKGEDKQNIDFVYLTEAKEKISEPDSEISEAVWFDLDNLPKPEEIAFDHWENIELYLKHKEKPFSLPILNL